MASFKKLKNGKVRALVKVNGHRASKVLPPQQAKAWARIKEAEFSKLYKIEDTTRRFEDLAIRYSKEISPKKGGCKWEQNRLERFDSASQRFNKVDSHLSNIKLKDMCLEDIEEWINKRLESVQGSTVNRELNLFGNMFTYARKWKWMSKNPMKDLARPKNPPSRKRRVSNTESEMICQAAGFIEGTTLTRQSHFTALAFLFAQETAMRMGEICSLEPDSINIETRVAHLKKTKNGDERDVPLTMRAVELLKLLPQKPNKNGHIFHHTPISLEANWRKVRDKTLIEDLHFHDTRHEATTRMAQLPEMNVLRLAKITGHKDLKYLMIYFNETAEEMVSVLDQKPAQPTKRPSTNLDEHSDALAAALLKKLSTQLTDNANRPSHTASQ